MRGFLDLVQVNFIGALTCVNHNAGYGPIREGEWNYVQFRPNGPGLRLEDGFLPASIDPDLGYRGEDQVRFGQRPKWCTVVGIGKKNYVR